MNADDDLDRRLRGEFDGMPVVPCPPEVTARILAEVVTTRRRRSAAPANARWLAWAAPLAAAAVVAVVILAAQPRPAPRYTEEELARARTEAVASLSMVVEVMQQTQRTAVGEVFGRKVPAALRASVQKALQGTEGGQG